MAEVRAKVTLFRHTPNPEGVIASAAKLCYAQNADAIAEQTQAETKKFVNKLGVLGHMSPLEHATFTFYIEGVSRAMTHQLVRHRIASYSQRSQRYVAHDSFDYIVPPQLEGKKVQRDDRSIDAVEFYRDAMDNLADQYRSLKEALGNQGEASNEDARYLLPNACETKIFVTMNARELLHFFEERLCSRAQWEIREVADLMLALAKKVCPSVFEGKGPKCVRLGRCPEGKMGCGRFEEMRKRYATA